MKVLILWLIWALTWPADIAGQSNIAASDGEESSGFPTGVDADSFNDRYGSLSRGNRIWKLPGREEMNFLSLLPECRSLL